MTNVESPTRTGYIALIGLPNVGKSTLFNALVGAKLSIVTPKPQTTRTRVLGILTCPVSQMIFLDTPGLLSPQHRLHEAMRRAVNRALSDADVVLALVDAADPEGTFGGLLRGVIDRAKSPVVLAANKIDLLPPGVEETLPGRLGRPVLPISALRGTNLDALRQALEERLPIGPFLYSPDLLSEQPERFFAAELIREVLFTRLHQELPYAAAVSIEEFRESEGGQSSESSGVGRVKTYIRATIYVERESQKGIVIGAGGRSLKAIGQEARAKVEGFLGRPLYLDLWVKVREGWRKRDADLREFGYLE